MSLRREPGRGVRPLLVSALLLSAASAPGCTPSEVGTVSTGGGQSDLAKKRFDETPPPKSAKSGRPAGR